MGQTLVLIVAGLWFCVIAIHISLSLYFPWKKKKGKKESLVLSQMQIQVNNSLGDPNPWVVTTTTTTATEDSSVAVPPVVDNRRYDLQIRDLSWELERYINAAQFDDAAEVAKQLSRLTTTGPSEVKTEVRTEKGDKTRFDIIG